MSIHHKFTIYYFESTLFRVQYHQNEVFFFNTSLLSYLVNSWILSGLHLVAPSHERHLKSVTMFNLSTLMISLIFIFFFIKE